MAKVRGWCFTINNYTDADIHAVRSIECEYIVYGAENGPDDGTPHLQGFVYFRNARHLGGVKRDLGGRAHLEPKSGHSTFEQCRDYCIKDGEFEERGTCPVDPKAKGNAEKERWRSAREAALEGRFDEIDDDLYIRYQNSFKRMRNEDGAPPDNLPSAPTYGVWIWGPPRTGKSHRARNEFGSDPYLKGLNKWWDGYTGQDNVLMEEVAPEHAQWIVPLLKQWVDKWTFSAEFKGGRKVIRPKRFIITSNYSIEECFAGRDADALMSRFEVVHMDQPYQH